MDYKRSGDILDKTEIKPMIELSEETEGTNPKTILFYQLRGQRSIERSMKRRGGKYETVTGQLASYWTGRRSEAETKPREQKCNKSPL
jgi:hypothetical protein